MLRSVGTALPERKGRGIGNGGIMTNFITHDLQKNTLECKGCYERVEIPSRILRAKMPQEAALIFKQEFARKHLDDGCDEAADRIAEASWANRHARETAKRVLGMQC